LIIESVCLNMLPIGNRTMVAKDFRPVHTQPIDFRDLSSLKLEAQRALKQADVLQQAAKAPAPFADLEASQRALKHADTLRQAAERAMSPLGFEAAQRALKQADVLEQVAKAAAPFADLEASQRALKHADTLRQAAERAMSPLGFEAAQRALMQADVLQRALKRADVLPRAAEVAVSPQASDSPRSLNVQANASAISPRRQRAFREVGKARQAVVDPRDIGVAVRIAREKMNLSQQRFADLAGVGRRFLSELENGKATIEFGKVLLVCKAAGIDLVAIQR
jgi:HTH-type transcriptional regulator/antitoxin HipB